MSLPVLNIDLKLNLKRINALVKDDLDDFDRLISQRLGSDIRLVNEISRHIIDAKGKRIRPLVSLLASRAVTESPSNHVLAALIIELIHTATLLHDDVVDQSLLRRGKPTANAKFGPKPSVLVGDFLYSRSFQLMNEIENEQMMKIMSNTTNTIAEGEVLQFMSANNPKLTEEDYMQIIYRKTSALFEAATEISGVIQNQEKEICLALKKYGRHLGNAFQIIDDCLDYNSSETVLGKNIGDDLMEGKTTLPLIIAQQRGTAAENHLISEAIFNGDLTNLKSILLIIEATESIEYCIERATEETNHAIAELEALPSTKYKDGLIKLATLALGRSN